MRRGIRIGLAGLLMVGLLSAAPAAFARGGAGVVKTGHCSASSTWKLKAKHDNGRIEVEFEVDTNVVGQSWNVVMKDNGVQFFSGTKVTKAPSGSFTVRKLTANRSGTDKITGNAMNPASGETCAGSVSL
jgi:hypothetical protein